MQFCGGEIRGIIGDISYDSLNFILELLDEYIELIEQMNGEESGANSDAVKYEY